MNRLKLFVAVIVSALLWVACGGGGTQNTNSNTAPQPAAPAASSSNTSSASQPAAVSSANANTPAEEKKAPEKKDESKNEAAKTAPNIDAGALFTSNKCAGCHGADGKGNPKIKGAPDFTDAAWQKKQSDAELIAAVKNGKKPIMPPFAEKLSDPEIKALVAYVRKFAK